MYGAVHSTGFRWNPPRFLWTIVPVELTLVCYEIAVVWLDGQFFFLNSK